MTTDNVLDLIGNTPLIEIKPHKIFAKAEFLNPGGSIKDRVALAMIEGAERNDRINKDTVLVEPTSGNTGIGLALVGRLKGYKVIIVMPENMSEERKRLITSLKAELILTPAGKNIDGAVRKAEEIVAATPGAVSLQQFENPDNPRAHFEGTARELNCKYRLMTGISAGVNVFAARKVAAEYPDARVSTILPDRVERYFSSYMM